METIKVKMKRTKVKMKRTKDRMKRKSIIILLALVLTSSFVSAANVGVSPANVNFDNVLRNGYAERPVFVTIDSQIPTTVFFYSWGEIADWISISENKVEVSKGSPARLMVSVSPPADIPNGRYTGFIRINSTKLADHTTGTSSTIIPTLELAINVEITDLEFRQCSATNFAISSAEAGDDIIFTTDILNEGNVRFSPRIDFEIWDQESINLVKEISFSKNVITPTQSERIIVKIPTKDLEIGQYWVDVSAVDCYNEETLTFDVLEEGALRASGSLESIFVEPWADIDDIVPITASFKNSGEKALEARFEGKITKNRKIIQLLESDQDLFVQVGEKDSFQFYFTPKEEGKYIISGRVFYDSKRTYEKSAVLNIRPSGGIGKTIFKILLYLSLLIIIAILIYLIRRERKTYMTNLRRLKR